MAETNYIGDVRVVEDVAAATNYIGDVRAFDTAAECENFIGYVDGVDDPATSKNYIGDVRVVTDIADVTNYIGDVHSWSTLNYEPEILTYIAGLTTPLSSKQKTDLNTFVKTIKNEIGITALSQIADAVHILSAETGEASLRNIVRNKHYGTLINNPAHTPYEGFKGNGTSQCIDIDFIPARDGVTYALNSASIGVYSRTNDASANFVDIGVIDGNNSAYLSYIFAGTCYASINSVIGAGSFTGLNPTTGLFMRVRSDNSIVHAYISNDEVSIANPVPSFALSTLKIFLLAAGGAGNAPSSFSKRQLALSWIGRALTRTEQIIVNTAFETYLESNGKQLVVKDANIVWEGDSRTWGRHLPEVTAALIPTKKYTLVNNAVSGSNIEQMIIRGAFVDTRLKAGKTNILNVWCGYNINDGDATPAGKYALLASYCTARKAAGWKVNVCTEIDGQLATYPAWHTDYITLNTLIRNNHAFANSMTDLGADARLQNALDTTYYTADKVHPNAAGNSVIAALIAPNILALT